MLHKHIVVNSNAPRSKMNVAIFARETDVHVKHSHGMAGAINVSCLTRFVWQETGVDALFYLTRNSS